MRKIFYIYLTFICIGMSGCKLDNSHNGDLDGYWKLSSVDTLTSGGIADLTESSLFWSVQKNLLMVRDNNDESNQGYVMRFQQTDSTLLLTDAQRYNKATGNELLEDFAPLHRFGITTQPEEFNLDHLTSRRMTLSNSRLRLNFKKF